jgi:hypothetical protein
MQGTAMIDYARLMLSLTRHVVTLRAAVECVCRLPLPELGDVFVAGQERIQERLAAVEGALGQARPTDCQGRDGMIRYRAAREQYIAAWESLKKPLDQMRYLRAQFTVGSDGMVHMEDDVRAFLEMIDPKRCDF